MSVLVRGMEMPTSCDNCWALDDYGDYPRCRITEEQRGYNFPIREKRMDKCPLVPVPPHGRLIDADAFAAEMKKRQDACSEWRDDIKSGGGYGTELYYRADSFFGAMCEAKLTLDKIHTIITASEGDKE